MTPDRYTCEEVLRRLDDFLDRELDGSEEKLVQEHIDTCANCLREYEFEKTVLQQVKAKVRRLSVPADLMRRIARAIEADSAGTDS